MILTGFINPYTYENVFFPFTIYDSNINYYISELLPMTLGGDNKPVIIMTLLFLGVAIIFEVIGRSPMITCFLNTEQSGYKGLIFLIPITSTLLVIFQNIYDLKFRELFLNDRQVREAYKLNSMYILLFSLLHFPMYFLIIITALKTFGILE